MILFRSAIIFLLLTASAAAQSLTLLAIEIGVVGQSTAVSGFSGYPVTAHGTYTGTAPTSVTGVWSAGCGGGSATVVQFATNLFPVANTGSSNAGASGTYVAGVNVPSTPGTCTLTLTDNLGASSAPLATTIYSYPSGGTITSDIHNAPGWLASHTYMQPQATVTFTNGSANIAWANSMVAGTPVYFRTSGTLPTNFKVATAYYVIATGLSGSNVQVSATVGGSAVVAGSAGAGTQTGYAGGAHTRVNNGAGWNAGSSTWNPGSALSAYELTSGTCTSASSGGPSGTGASISDGTCTWKYLSNTDYISMTAWARDAPAWVSGTTFTYGGYTTTNIGGNFRSYALESPDHNGGNQNAMCTSTVAPSGTGTIGNSYAFGWLDTADGCSWAYMGDILYSSQVSTMPFVTYSTNGDVSHLSRPYTAHLWNDREYIAGRNGETSPITAIDHQGGAHCCSSEANIFYCVGPTPSTDCPFVTVEPAAGEGFASAMTPTTPLIGYDVLNGVGFHNPGVSSTIGYANHPTGFTGGIFNFKFNGMQVQSATTDGFLAYNNIYLTNSIVDGGFAGQDQGSAVWLDVPDIVANNLIISHGPMGLSFKYGSSVALFNTIANVGSTSNAVCVSYQWAWVWVNLIAANNACYNFPHFGSWNSKDEAGNPGYIGIFDSSSKNNVTDTPAPDGNQRTVTFTNGSANIGWPSNTLTAGTQVYLQTSGTLPTNFAPHTPYFVIATGLSSSNVQVSATLGGSAIVAGSAGSGVSNGFPSDDVPVGGNFTGGTVMIVPNSTYGASGASMFVSPGSDWRPGAALNGAGASYGTFSWGCAAGGCVPTSLNFDTPDFLGTTRPQSSSWTVGVEQMTSGAPPTVGGLHFGFTR